MASSTSGKLCFYILAAAAALFCLVTFVSKRTSAKSPAHELPAGWIAAPAQFVESADTYKFLVTDAARRLNGITASSNFKTIQREQDQARGISDRLSTPCSEKNPGPICMPPGFQYDEKFKALAPIKASAPAIGPSLTKEPQPAK